MRMFLFSRLLPAASIIVFGLGASANVFAATSTITVTASTVLAQQSSGKISIVVHRNGGSTGAATATYLTRNGSAEAGADFTGQTGSLQWSAGDASTKTITVALLSTPFSGTRTFAITLSKATGATLGLPNSTVVTLQGSKVAGTGTTGDAGAGPAAKLAAKLGKPTQLLIGLGGQGTVDRVSAIESQATKVDIYESYLGLGDWTAWNGPPCDYVCISADAAESLGAIPMFTQYQMANDGDGNISAANDGAFMKTYWARVKILFEDLAAYNKPALVNFEPDFWGYVERAAPNSDPTKIPAVVSSNPDCASLPNNATGVAGCLLTMARKYAPKALVGFPPSAWGGDTTADVVAFMNAVGAPKADFIVEQTSDRDAGCEEVSPQPSECAGRSPTGWYWDETNETHPNFQDHLTEAKAFHTGIGNLPLIWWQTPEGVPSTTRGGSPYHYRDNRMRYFMTHTADLVAAGGLGVVFSTGEIHQTNMTTDGGQFQSFDSAYFAKPAKLP